jgi:hypothetical protein
VNSFFCVFGLNAISISKNNLSISQDDWELDVSSSVPAWIAWQGQGPHGKGLVIIAFIEQRDYNLDNLKKVYAALSKRQQESFYIKIEFFTSKEKTREEAYYKKENILPIEAYYAKDPSIKKKDNSLTPKVSWLSSSYFRSQNEEWIIFDDPETKTSKRIVLREPPVKVTPLSELQEAIKKGDIFKIQKLLDSGVSVNARGDDNDWTPLMLAIEYDKVNVAEFLIHKGANVNLGRKKGWTPLIMASVSGDLDFVKFLIRAGADINLGESDGQTPLKYASCQGHYDVVAYLIKCGADVNKADNDGETPLMCASGQGVDEDTRLADRQRIYKVISHLIKSGADVNLKNKEGETALSKTWDEKIVKILLKAGAIK